MLTKGSSSNMNKWLVATTAITNPKRFSGLSLGSSVAPHLSPTVASLLPLHLFPPPPSSKLGSETQDMWAESSSCPASTHQSSLPNKDSSVPKRNSRRGEKGYSPSVQKQACIWNLEVEKQTKLRDGENYSRSKKPLRRGSRWEPKNKTTEEKVDLYRGSGNTQG